MSKQNNVNPDHYRVAGGERPGQTVGQASIEHAQLEATRTRWTERRRKREKVTNQKSKVKS